MIMSTSNLDTPGTSSMVKRDFHKFKSSTIKKENKLFRPWVTCRCVDCNLNIDSKKLMDIMKKALKPSKSIIDEEVNRNKRQTHRKDSLEDYSDNRSQASDDCTIIYQDNNP